MKVHDFFLGWDYVFVLVWFQISYEFCKYHNTFSLIVQRDNLLNVQTKLLSVQDSLLKELHKINEV